MRVSIITVVFNGEDTIEDTILSVASQTYDDIEHIIIDGASTDQTMDIINRYAGKIAVVVSEPDQGIYDAMNKGITLATGEIIGFLNADDVYADKRVVETIADIFKTSDAEGCFGDLVYVRRNDLSKVVRHWQSGHYKKNAFSMGWMPAHPTFFAKSRVYKRYGGFDLSYKLAADFELLARLIGRHNIKTFYVPKVLVKMRLGGVTNKSITNVLRQNIEIYRALKSNGLPVSCFFIIKKIYVRIKQFIAGFVYGKA